MTLGVFGVIVLYLLANVTYVVTLPFNEIAHAPQDRVGTAVSKPCSAARAPS
jgi:APA family basic amino acid/polyamine antiporter